MRRSRRPPFAFGLLLAATASVIAVTAAGAGEEAKAPGTIRAQAVREGVAVALEVAAVDGAAVREGTDTRFHFEISDTATGNPIAGAFPAAWLERLPDAGSAREPVDCKRRVEQYLGGSLFDRPEVDLNVYFILSLNHDGTITVIDPHLGFGGTRLLALVDLGGPGEDWVMSPDRRRLYVSVPDTGKVLVIDTASFTVTARVDAGPRPGRLALAPDGSTLWVTLADGQGVAAVRTDGLAVTRLPAGLGRHEIALSDDGRFAFVTNRGSSTLTVIDAVRLEVRGQVVLSAPPSAVAFSPLGRAAYVASEEKGTIEIVDPLAPAALAVRGKIDGAPGYTALRFAPGGRLAFLPNPVAGHVAILDAASDRIVQRAPFESEPDQVTFSNELAYVRQRKSEIVRMIPLDQVGVEGKAVPAVDFPGGQKPLGSGVLASPAASIVQAPGANAVLVANPADKTIYYYREGMAAPMGGFANYSRQPRAVLTLDRTLKESAAGRYETVARIPLPGRHRLAFLLDAPRAVHCFEFEVAETPERAAERRPPLVVVPLFEDLTAREGERLHLRFRALEPQKGEPKPGLPDLGVLVYLSSGAWRKSLVARDAGGGVYEVDFVPPDEGTFKIAVQCPSQHLAYNRTPERLLTVVAGRKR